MSVIHKGVKLHRTVEWYGSAWRRLLVMEVIVGSWPRSGETMTVISNPWPFPGEELGSQSVRKETSFLSALRHSSKMRIGELTRKQLKLRRVSNVRRTCEPPLPTSIRRST